MSVPTRKNRLSPPFMHAFRSAFEQKDSRQKQDLRDAAGDRIIAPRRAAVRATISEPNLRREVARDLEALVNAVAFESTEDLSDFDGVRKSILNYGLPDLIHRTIDEAGVNLIEDEIANALRRYEPRLVANTIKVSRDDNLDKDELKVRFLVRADLICAPVNVPVEFIADVEIDSGDVVVKKA
ncbi:type VI secretion system lysozyme-related protein [Methylocella silvestris BL2]|uniref:Type VI secretion system lysozyme-related protein n=1 Tax=Methylocella silvestris (strain DSM 15510 / CIP 108128 / LMG 27833 / NCIMB 13906 / BL2) TaxID=395965 RepID=B8EIH4_METSB|nr:type VI secretion system baseplate subunit TssE [Methylocella silvestris]ACK51293.1 type VI secretion system lysozyme-related protein [Methylocella silvestris BL2]